MVNFGKKDAVLPIEVYAFDTVSLGFTAACTDGGGLDDHSPINFDLTLHDVTCFKYGRLQVIRDMFELHASKAHCIAIFEPERDVLELWNLLNVESI